VSTTAITVVLLQNGMDLRSRNQNDIILVQLEGASYVKVEENGEPTTSRLIDPLVRFLYVECLACFIGTQNCLSPYKSVLVKQ
jgi:hypothetical protein